MPQLDITTFSSQVFWFFLSFFLLFFIINYLFLPRLEKKIHNRSKKVLNSFHYSMYLLKLAESQIMEYHKLLEKSELKMRSVVSSACVQVEKLKVDIAKQLEDDSKKTHELVKKEIESFKVKHMGKLKKMADSLTLIYYAKLHNTEIDEGKFFIHKKS